MNKKLIINHSSFIIRKSGGFTLVELLASVVVLVAIGSIVAGILSSSLRGSNKTNTIENIRQNGNYALNQMSKDIEYAQAFDGRNTGLSNDDGLTYDTSCILALSPTPIPVTRYSLITVRSTAQLANNEVTMYNCNDTTSSPPVPSVSSPVLSANGTSLIDTNLVSLLNCSLTCIQNKPTDIPIIKINFSIGPTSSSSSNLVENSTPPIVFETSITLRNYKR